MPIFTGTDLAEVVALINRDNADLPWPLNETDFIFGTPEVIANPTDGRNTRIKVTPKGSSHYRGAMTLTYARRDLSNLFRGQNVRFTRWLNDGASMTLTEAITAINQLYGINLPPTKMTGTAWSSANNGTSRTWTAAASNLAYVGSMTVTWYRGLQQLGVDILTVSELAGAQWPGGNDFVAEPDRKFRGEFLLNSMDISEFAVANNWNGTGLGPVALNHASAAALISWINTRAGVNFNANAYDAVNNPLGGMGNYNFVTGTTVASLGGVPAHYNKPGFTYVMAMDLRNHPLVKALVPLYFNL